MIESLAGPVARPPMPGRRTRLRPAFEETSSASRSRERRPEDVVTTSELRRRRPEAPKLSSARQVASPVEDEAARLRLEKRVTAHLPAGRLVLVITDNRYTMISVRRDRGQLFFVRLHH